MQPAFVVSVASVSQFFFDIFICLELVHQGLELKKKKKVNHHPKHPGIHFRDMKRQNNWLRENVFDALENYLFCCACIRATFGISKQQIACQKAIKR